MHARWAFLDGASSEFELIIMSISEVTSAEITRKEFSHNDIVITEDEKLPLHFNERVGCKRSFR